MAPAEAPHQINRIDTPPGGSLGVTAAPFIRSGTDAPGCHSAADTRHAWI
jgi:hypothetical protein